MNTLQFGSLSPTVTFNVFPSEPSLVIHDGKTYAVDFDDVLPFLPVYDGAETDGGVINTLILGAQSTIESLTDLDLVKKTRRAVWANPADVIALPRNNQNIILVEQYIGDDWISTEKYEVFGETKKRVKLREQYPTRITFTSGFDFCPSDLKAGVLHQTAFLYKNRSDANEVEAETRGGLAMSARNAISDYLQ